jgi:hypothetical protein
MASSIEQFLYGDAVIPVDGEVGDYFIAELGLAERLISLRIASDRRPYSFQWVRFREAGLNSLIQTSSEADALLLPWYIVGFYSWECGNGFWKFNLNCWHTRWSWNSHWPVVEDAT